MSASVTGEFDKESVDRIVNHMNDDHQDALILYLKAFLNVNPESKSSVTMTDIDFLGIEISYVEESTEKCCRIEFKDTIGGPIAGHSEARKALVDMVKIAGEIIA